MRYLLVKREVAAYTRARPQGQFGPPIYVPQHFDRRSAAVAAAAALPASAAYGLSLPPLAHPASLSDLTRGTDRGYAAVTDATKHLLREHIENNPRLGLSWDKVKGGAKHLFSELKEKFNVRETAKKLIQLGKEHGPGFLAFAIALEAFEQIGIPAFFTAIHKPYLIPLALLFHTEPVMYPLYFAVEGLIRRRKAMTRQEFAKAMADWELLKARRVSAYTRARAQGQMGLPIFVPEHSDVRPAARPRPVAVRITSAAPERQLSMIFGGQSTPPAPEAPKAVQAAQKILPAAKPAPARQKALMWETAPSGWKVAIAGHGRYIIKNGGLYYTRRGGAEELLARDLADMAEGRAAAEKHNIETPKPAPAATEAKMQHYGISLDPDPTARGGFYVSMIDPSQSGGINRYALLAGPFETHEEAKGHIDAARRAADKADPWSHFAAFGTARIADPEKRTVGKLNADLGLPSHLGPQVRADEEEQRAQVAAMKREMEQRRAEEAARKVRDEREYEEAKRTQPERARAAVMRRTTGADRGPLPHTGFWNQWEIEEGAERHYENLNVRRGWNLLRRLVDATNDQSDGWPHWKAPSQSARTLQSHLQRAGRSGAITDAELKAAVSPIRSMVTRQKRIQAEHGNTFDFDVDAALAEGAGEEEEEDPYRAARPMKKFTGTRAALLKRAQEFADHIKAEYGSSYSDESLRSMLLGWEGDWSYAEDEYRAAHAETAPYAHTYWELGIGKPTDPRELERYEENMREAKVPKPW